MTAPATAELPTQHLPRPPDAARAPSRWRAVLLALAVAVAFADSSIVVLALPQLLGDFGATITSVSWVVTSYNVAVAILALALIPFVRRLRADRLTRWGLIIFCAACVACAVAGGLGVLVAARAVQGAGAALLLAGTVPLLGALCGSQARGAVVWGAAG
ncbi:MAG TPA: MFS transporter, partial [Miltoncostaeaceae bacterium]|nr:MFS transporter [Miltoncostaeaceae bacterium]